MTGGRRAEFFVTAGGVYSIADLNGKMKYVVEITDAYSCLLHFPLKVYETVILSPFVPKASLE
jgi:hypothetical protein